MLKTRMPSIFTIFAAATLTLFAGSAAAQQQPQAQGQAQPQAPASPRAQAQQVQQQLVQIQRATLKENPELRDQHEALQTLINETMKEQGATPEEDSARLQEIRKEAQGGDLDQKKRQELASEFQKIQQDLMRAQQKAMQNEEVKTKQQEFNTALLDAMQAQNPKTEELLAKMREIQKQQQQRLQQQQGGQGGPAPQ